jgi:serine/threonine protein phosphatase PrpC
MGAESSQSTDADVSADNPTVSVVMTAAALQHQGLVRERQEDSCLAHVLTDKPAVLLVVADGMGGHQAGDIASQAAVEAVAQALLPVLNSLQPSATVRLPERDEEDEAPAQAANPLRTVSLSQATVVLSETAVAQTPQWDILLARAVQGVQNAVRSVAARIDALDNAGCTLTLALVVGQTLHLAHVGDSRAYLWRQSQLRQLTTDHSGAAALVAAGLITAEEARTHAAAHQLYRYLGGESGSAKPDILQVRLQSEDLLLLCSDGLWGMVSDAEIAGHLIGVSDLAVAAQALIDAANNAGGEDNITAVLAQIKVTGQE